MNISSSFGSHSRRQCDEETFQVLAHSPVRGSTEWWSQVEQQLERLGFHSGMEEEMLRLADPEDVDIPDDIHKLVHVAWEGFQHGHAPELCHEGVGGTYFMCNKNGKRVAVFKPQDEEPFHVNNPKGFRPRRESDAGFKNGILVGEASVRECAAYLLDHGQFAGVPATSLCLCEHSAFNYDNTMTPKPSRIIQPSKSKIKLGSFQKYIKNDGDTEDIASSLLAKFPVSEVHKIAVLDIRLCNTDRHGGNILYKQVDDGRTKTYNLIPIDHGYTLPSTLGEAFFTWLIWPQAKQPFDLKTKHYIQTLDAEMDIHLLQEKFGRTLDSRHFRNLRITTLLLKLAVANDLTPYQIGDMMSRADLKKPCVLENLCEQAQQSCGDSVDDKVFLSQLKPLLELEISKLSHNFKN